MKHRLQLRRFIGGDPGKSQPDKEPGDYTPTRTEATPHGSAADLISSKLDDQTNRHVVAIDIDLPCHLIETSPGKHHLIVEKAMPWDQYRLILVALEAAGIIEPGYLEASLARRATYLRIHPTTPLEVDLPDSHNQGDLL